MLDLKFVRKNPEVVRSDLKKRNDVEKLKWIDDLLEKDAKSKKLTLEVEEMRRQRNVISQEINKVKKAGKDASKLLHDAATLPKRIMDAENELQEITGKIQFYLMRLPNVLHESVPIGKDDNYNVVVREVGKKKRYDFELKSHVDLLSLLDVADLERGAKISGARFYFLKNELVMLDYALQKFGLDLLHKKGYTLIEPPLMMQRKPYEGVTDLADFENVMYKVEGEDNYLIATSEHPMAAMHMGEAFENKGLPLKYAGISPCFRKEVGAHGKDTKGIFRVHNFNKIEQFVFCKPGDSWKLHEELLANAEEFFTSLEIPYRVVNVCTGDMGVIAAKKYDVEAWMPVQKTFREVVSASNCTSYQAVRLNIKYRKDDGEKDFVHTLNSTMVATSRAMVAILENFQNKDGSVDIPDVLVPYMRGIDKIKPKKVA